MWFSAGANDLDSTITVGYRQSTTGIAVFQPGVILVCPSATRMVDPNGALRDSSAKVERKFASQARQGFLALPRPNPPR